MIDNMKIKEYITLFNESLTELDKEVNDFIENGWQPFGPQIQDRQDAERIWYSQVMVKYSKKA